jgi:hypothetical protein
MYRSSVKKFIQGVLCLLDEGRDVRFADVADRLQEYTVDDILRALRVDKAHGIDDGIPEEDWNAIIEYIGRFTAAHGPRGVTFFDGVIERSFLCWLAAIGVELLAEL